jgi:hypothetical protein
MSSTVDTIVNRNLVVFCTNTLNSMVLLFKKKLNFLFYYK